jgi:hypothetical protein
MRKLFPLHYLFSHFTNKYIIPTVYMLYMRRERPYHKATNFGLGWSEICYRYWHGLFPSPPRPNHYYDPPHFLTNGYLDILPHGNVGRSINLTIHPHLLCAWSFTSITLYCVVLNVIHGHLYVIWYTYLYSECCLNRYISWHFKHFFPLLEL